MFRCYRKDGSTKAWHYLCGLMQADKKNMERMNEHVAEADYSQLQHFLSESTWDYRPVFDKVSQDANALLGGHPLTGLLIDETAFAKKGTKSVGVARQYNGRLGKVDNSQVAVFGALSIGNRSTLIDAEFYLPESWTSDAARCREARIPEERLGFLTKIELALRIVRRQRELGVAFGYVCADGLYGNSSKFCRELEDMGEVFLVHVHCNQKVFVEKPELAASGNVDPSCGSVRVDKLVSELTEGDWKEVRVRKTTTGQLIIHAWSSTVWIWDAESKDLRERVLFVRRDQNGDTKYCITNSPEGTSLHTLALMESQRFWIERSFEDGKSEAGLADYQARGWLAWHHHVALVMMAMLFMLKQKMVFGESCPQLSCRDVKELLEKFLPSKAMDVEDIVTRVKMRHKRRNAASESKARRQMEQLGRGP